jgi:hypothetical protein
MNGWAWATVAIWCAWGAFVLFRIWDRRRV